MAEHGEGLGKGLSSTNQGYSIPEAARHLSFKFYLSGRGYCQNTWDSVVLPLIRP
jgi:hypothetical protein